MAGTDYAFDLMLNLRPDHMEYGDWIELIQFIDGKIGRGEAQSHEDLSEIFNRMKPFIRIMELYKQVFAYAEDLNMDSEQLLNVMNDDLAFIDSINRYAIGLGYESELWNTGIEQAIAAITTCDSRLLAYINGDINIEWFNDSNVRSPVREFEHEPSRSPSQRSPPPRRVIRKSKPSVRTETRESKREPSRSPPQRSPPPNIEEDDDDLSGFFIQ
jgi:hypothetical protein